MGLFLFAKVWHKTECQSEILGILFVSRTMVEQKNKTIIAKTLEKQPIIILITLILIKAHDPEAILCVKKQNLFSCEIKEILNQCTFCLNSYFFCFRQTTGFLSTLNTSEMHINLCIGKWSHQIQSHTLLLEVFLKKNLQISWFQTYLSDDKSAFKRTKVSREMN